LLRLFAVLLLTANLAVYAWTQGWLSPLAMPPMSSEREPERLAQQVRPESIKLLSPQAAAEARRAAQAASSATPGTDTSRPGVSVR
jgi:hypothetical protein